jgi:hypothetical protein
MARCVCTDSSEFQHPAIHSILLPVRPAEVRQRSDTQQVNVMARCERQPVAAESDMPVLFPAFLNLGSHHPSQDHN